jgi:hypothetical protein
MLRAGFASDSVSFSGRVPTLFLSTSLNDDYHQPTDTADEINEDQMARAAALVLHILNSLGG